MIPASTSAFHTRPAEWRRLRAMHARTLPQPCPFCHNPVWPHQLWDLDHAVPRAYGGGDETVRPAHRYCNRHAGRLVRMRKGRPSIPTRTW